MCLCLLPCVTIYSILFPGGSHGKTSAFNAGDLGLIPGLGRFPGGGNGNPLQYSCLENSMDRGAWWATVHGVTKRQATLSDFTFSLFSFSLRNVLIGVTNCMVTVSISQVRAASLEKYQNARSFLTCCNLMQKKEKEIKLF